MTTDAKVLIGDGPDSLEGTRVDTPAGTALFREGVVVSDPDVAAARAKIVNAAPAADAYGLVVRIAGGSGGGAVASDVSVINEVEVKNEAGNPLSVSGTVSVSNLPAVQPVSDNGGSLTVDGTVTVGNFPATQAVSGTVTANLGTLNGAATDTSVQAVTTSLGTDGATPPTIPGTGVRGWLRSIYDTLKATLTVSGTVTANAGTGTFNTRALASGTDSVTTVPSGTQTVSGTVTVSQATAANLNATVTGTVNAAQSGTWNITNVTGTVSLPTGAATSANQTTGNTSLASLDGKIPDESGVWGYNAGTSGTLAVAANKRLLSISATAPIATAASMTINAGQTITIPAGATITISPRANLTAPTLVFTGTSAYFVEFVE